MFLLCPGIRQMPIKGWRPGDQRARHLHDILLKPPAHSETEGPFQIKLHVSLLILIKLHAEIWQFSISWTLYLVWGRLVAAPVSILTAGRTLLVVSKFALVSSGWYHFLPQLKDYASQVDWSLKSWPLIEMYQHLLSHWTKICFIQFHNSRILLPCALICHQCIFIKYPSTKSIVAHSSPKFCTSVCNKTPGHLLQSKKPSQQNRGKAYSGSIIFFPLKVNRDLAN